MRDLHEVSNEGDFIEMDGEFYIYTGRELVHVDHYDYNYKKIQQWD